MAMLAILTLIVMTACRDVSWREFGFCRPRARWLRFAGRAMLLGAASTLILKASGGGGLDSAMAGVAPFEIVVLILLVATCVEELFVRGWMQGFLAPLSERRMGLLGTSISVPVATGALAFGAMHLSLTLSTIDALTIVCVLAFTTLLGALAGVARERSGSLVAAVGTHLAGNVGGVLGGIAYAIGTRAIHG